MVRADESKVQGKAGGQVTTAIPSFVRDKLSDLVPEEARQQPAVLERRHSPVAGAVLRWTPVPGSPGTFTVQYVEWEAPERKVARVG